MKMRIALLSLLTIVCLVVAVAPAMADNLIYSNGAINGNVKGYTINFGFSVTDSFTVGGNGFSVETLSIGAWLIPGDHFDSVDMLFGSAPFGNDDGQRLGVAATSFNDLGLNSFGYDIQQINFTFDNLRLLPGTYWLTLQNAVESNFGDPLYWDQNSGPSQAQDSALGVIPSESFTLNGTPLGGTTPEPSSIMLFGSGVLGLAGVLRRKLNR